MYTESPVIVKTKMKLISVRRSPENCGSKIYVCTLWRSVVFIWPKS